MTELRKGQQVWVRGVVEEPNVEGDVVVDIGPVVDAFLPEQVRVEPPGNVPPTYLARREAMVRSMIESPFWQDAAFAQLVKEADIALRAIDETPVPVQQPREYRVVFDGPPAPESGRFIEVEDEHGRSRKFGEWVERGDGWWELRLPRGGEHE